jgi:hypothetical protein
VLGYYGDPGTGSPVAFKSTPPEVMINWPSTYGSNFSQNYNTEATFYYGQDPGIGFTIDSIRFKQTVTKIDSVDAWGSLTTPLGTYNSVRVKDWKHTIDTIDVYIQMLGGWMNAAVEEDTTLIYQWWANGLGFTLAEIDVDDQTGAVTGARWLKAVPSPTSINEYAVKVLTYPNPATDALTFEMGTAEAAFINIYDATGREIESVNVKDRTTVVNTSALATGLYLYSITGADRRELSRGNFHVVK